MTTHRMQMFYTAYALWLFAKACGDDRTIEGFVTDLTKSRFNGPLGDNTVWPEALGPKDASR